MSANTAPAGQNISFLQACADGPTLIAFSLTLIMTIGVAGITPVLPAVMQKFAATPISVAWVITIFTLPGVLILPLVGMLADRYGRKTVLMPSLVIFIFASVGAGLAESFAGLLFWRFVQGLGSTAMGFLPSVILADRYQGPALPRLMGYNAAVLSVGTAIAPALGGLFGALHWRLPLMLGLAALLPLIVALRIPLRGKAQGSGLKEYWGSSWATIKNPYTILLFIFGFLSFLMLYGPIITCLPLLQQQKFAATPMVIGIFSVLFSLGGCLSSAFLGRLTGRFSLRTLLAGSQLLYIAGLLAIPLVPASAMPFLALPLIIYGLGQGLNTPIVIMLQVRRAPDENKASIMSTHNMLMRLAQSLAPVMFGYIYHHASPTAAFFTGAFVAGIMVALSLLSPSPKKSKN